MRSTAPTTTGNLTSKTDAFGTTFIWNEENQLKQVTLPSDLTINDLAFSTAPVRELAPYRRDHRVFGGTRIVTA